MNLPGPDDFIDIHNHGAKPMHGVFSVENLVAAEERIPDEAAGLTYSIGIHPWHLTRENFTEQLVKVENYSRHTNVIALGEAGFDRLRVVLDFSLQKDVFKKQVIISEEVKKPLYIHCVRAWEELLSARKELRAVMPWLVHGFRGKSELAQSLVSKGMYISFWFEFTIRPEAAQLIKSLPAERIFLETDGGDIPISLIYEKVSGYLGLTIRQLKNQMYSNFMVFKGI